MDGRWLRQYAATQQPTLDMARAKVRCSIERYSESRFAQEAAIAARQNSFCSKYVECEAFGTSGSESQRPSP